MNTKIFFMIKSGYGNLDVYNSVYDKRSKTDLLILIK